MHRGWMAVKDMLAGSEIASAARGAVSRVADRRKSVGGVDPLTLEGCPHGLALRSVWVVRELVAHIRRVVAIVLTHAFLLSNAARSSPNAINCEPSGDDATGGRVRED